MKLTDYIVEFLREQGVNVVFGYQGGAITHLIDSVYKDSNIRMISTYHEQAAAFAAESYARVSGNIGIAIATSGPGATNLITGIGSAFFDSIPCLYITGQVNTFEYKRSDYIRQEGFQETDIVNIVKPITKYAVMIKESEKIRYYLEKAEYIAKSGRPGPVLIDIPMDIQRAEINEANLESFYDCDEYKNAEEYDVSIQDINAVIEMMRASKRPVILAGGGIRLSNATNELEKLIQITRIPVVTTLMGIDCVDHNNICHVGFAGSYGNRYSNLAVANSDLLIVLGSRLTTRQTSTMTDSFAREAKIVHIDIDNNELNIKVKECLSIQCDLKLFIHKLNENIVKSKYLFDYTWWREKISGNKELYPSYPTQKEINTLDPNEFMYKLGEVLNENSIICLDIGQNEIWAAQSLKTKKNQRLLNFGGMGPMGVALPAAIGAYSASPNSTIIAIAGDGGIQMNIQELQTVVREKMPIKMIIMNNRSLGMIRHFQEMYFQSKYYGTIEGYSTPDFIKISEAYGIETFKVSDERQFNELQEKLNNDRSYFIEIDLKNPTYVIPKLAMGRPIEDQEPLLNRNEFHNNMIIDIYQNKNR